MLNSEYSSSINYWTSSQIGYDKLIHFDFPQYSYRYMKGFKLPIICCIYIYYLQLTLIGAFPVWFATRKFIAISSQFMCLSIQSRIAAGIIYVNT